MSKFFLFGFLALVATNSYGEDRQETQCDRLVQNFNKQTALGVLHVARQNYGLDAPQTQVTNVRYERETAILSACIAQGR